MILTAELRKFRVEQMIEAQEFLKNQFALTETIEQKTIDGSSVRIIKTIPSKHPEINTVMHLLRSVEIYLTEQRSSQLDMFGDLDVKTMQVMKKTEPVGPTLFELMESLHETD